MDMADGHGGGHAGGHGDRHVGGHMGGHVGGHKGEHGAGHGGGHEGGHGGGHWGGADTRADAAADKGMQVWMRTQRRTRGRTRGRIWNRARLVNSGPDLAQIGKTMAQVGLFWSLTGKYGPNLPQFGAVWSSMVEIWSNLVHIDQTVGVLTIWGQFWTFRATLSPGNDRPLRRPSIPPSNLHALQNGAPHDAEVGARLPPGLVSQRSSSGRRQLKCSPAKVFAGNPGSHSKHFSHAFHPHNNMCARGIRFFPRNAAPFTWHNWLFRRLNATLSAEQASNCTEHGTTARMPCTEEHHNPTTPPDACRSVKT